MANKILGLDLGSTSIGWALVEENEDRNKSKIIKLGVRVNPLTTDELTDFEKGRPLSVNADRTEKRGARRNLQRFKLRRKNLMELLKEIGFISNATNLTETGNHTTHQTLELRSKSAKEKIEKEAFARVLLAINKKRGYKSNRKAKNEEEGSLIDGMDIAKKMYENNLTPGEFVHQLLKENKKFIPDFYRSDLQNEFDMIWNFQKQFYANILIDELYKELQGKNKTQTWAICKEPFHIEGVSQKGKANEKKVERYKWRTEGLNKQLDLEILAIVLQEINNDLNKSSGYLGEISDRSKELYFNNETVGENLYNQIKKNPHTSLKNQVFYRQDYLDEFEKIWETQAKFYPELTSKVKKEIRDVVIFYQRKLKSQKHLISNCEFEKYHKAVPKSSPLFQEFKIWQIINNVYFTNKTTKEKAFLDEDLRLELFEELNIKGGLKTKEVLKFCELKATEWDLNYKEGIEGNRTNESLYKAYHKIAEYEGSGFDWNKKSARAIKTELKAIFKAMNLNEELLEFDTEIKGNDFDKQLSYQLWHLLYASDDDKKLKEILIKKYGFKSEYAHLLTNVQLQQDYGSLSARALKKIIPHLKAGHQYDEACGFAGYNHSKSLTKEENDQRILKEKLCLLKKNELRNPVVEKILNQMIHVVNQVIETYGKPDEIRVELARELKKSAKERAEMTTNINRAKGTHLEIKNILQKEFGIKNPTRNDVIRYKLYQELKANKYHTLYTNTYIPQEKLFTQEIEIEHIIPKAKLFDDSFSNKTLAYSKPNKDKGDATAIDYINRDHKSEVEAYKARVENLFNKGKGSIGKSKRDKLLMEEKNIPDGFIDRDLRNSQYIAKKATQVLQEIVRTVNTTTGKITDRLRSDWDLINVMQELNLPRYKQIDESLIEEIEKKDGSFKVRIKDWSKRNDHRHHAMDALTVAFTKHSHVQYLNNLKGKSDKKGAIYGIQNKETKLDTKGRRRFIAPMPNFREDAKKHIEGILISFKAKNKVVTKNVNKTKLEGKGNYATKKELTPRGQLHKETVYAQIKEVVVKQEKVNAKFDKAKIHQVTKPNYKEALLKRLEEFGGDAKKAFAGKNSLAKNPVYLDSSKNKSVPELVKIQFFEDNYTIRKPITPDLKIDKIIDKGVQSILKNRLSEFNGDTKKAFSDLEKNPIWLNEEKGISIKRVSISGVKNAESLHSKKDHFGNEILDQNGNTQAVDFVSTGNNHHIAIYQDKNGKLQEKVVSFYEAVAKATAYMPVIDKNYNADLGWEFKFTMKQNEMFVFPSEDFNPQEVDLEDEKNTSLISKHLFRVQKISTKDYMFRHHLETNVEKIKSLQNHAYISIRNTEPLRNIIKVRTNHLGKIVQVGEY